MAKATYNVDDEEEAAEARKYAAEALRTLARSRIARLRSRRSGKRHDARWRRA